MVELGDETFLRMHFSLVNYSPLVSASSASHENVDVEKMTLDSFSVENQMVTLDSEVERVARFSIICTNSLIVLVREWPYLVSFVQTHSGHLGGRW